MVNTELEKENRELIGFHFTIGKKEDGTKPTKEEVAEEVCKILLNHAKGETEEVDVSNMKM